MNKEQIIANIERYINSVADEERKIYTDSLKKAVEENRKIKEIYPILGLAEIVQELQQEIKEQAQKETKGNTYVKRSKLITKLLKKSYPEQFTKGFYEEINGEKMKCCIIDGVYAFMLYDIDIPMFEKHEKPAFTVQKLLPDYKECTVCDFDIAEIKTALKLHKAKKDKSRCLIHINGKHYNAEFFINVVDGLGGTVKMYQSKNKLKCDMLESENGKALLMPCRA